MLQRLWEHHSRVDLGWHFCRDSVWNDGTYGSRGNRCRNHLGRAVVCHGRRPLFPSSPSRKLYFLDNVSNKPSSHLECCAKLLDPLNLTKLLDLPTHIHPLASPQPLRPRLPSKILPGKIWRALAMDLKPDGLSTSVTPTWTKAWVDPRLDEDGHSGGSMSYTVSLLKSMQTRGWEDWSSRRLHLDYSTILGMCYVKGLHFPSTLVPSEKAKGLGFSSGPTEPCGQGRKSERERTNRSRICQRLLA